MKKKNAIPSLRQILVSRLIMLVLAAILSLAVTAQGNLNRANEFFAGLAASGKSPGNCNYGGNLSFSHPLIKKLNLMADAGIYLRKTGASSLKQFQLMAGAGLQPANNGAARILFSPHLLFGVTDIASTYKFENMSFNNSQVGISLAAGSDILFPINDRIAFAARMDCTPTLLAGSINYDFRFGVGIKIKFKKDDESSVPKYSTSDETRNEFISLSAYDFEDDPKLEGTNKDNPHQTQGKECKGIDEFDYYNEKQNPVSVTLIIRRTGACNVHVKVEKLTEKPGNKKDGEEKKDAGTTKTKEDIKADESKVKDGKWKKTKLFEYDVENVQGDDVYSFNLDKKTRIRVTISCGGSGGDCGFTRKFVVTTGEKTEVQNENAAPKLELAAPKRLEKLDQFNPMGNRCISDDLVFYKITNRDVKQTMTVHFKAVSECGCYFEAYANEAAAVKEETPKPLEGGELGVGHKDESPKIAKPVEKGKVSTTGTEQTITIRPGKSIYFKGRCPLQQPMPGPCKGRIEITGITFTSK